MTTSTPPIVVPHPWSAEALLAKAQRYAEEMRSHASDEWQFVLWSSLALEILGRAALSNQGQALLAERERSHLFYALNLPVKATKFVPRSIDIKEVFHRLSELVTDFNTDLLNFAIHHMERRNEELHSGSTPLDGLKASGWLPIFYWSCEIMLKSMDKALSDFFDPSTASTAATMISAYRDKSAKAISKTINAYKMTWEAKFEAEREKAANKAENWATRHEGHRVPCPACACVALVSGEPSAPAIKDIVGDEITETQQFLPSKFECVACGLRISGLSQLSACGLGESFKATMTYDAAEFYIQRDMLDGYEPDYNEP